MATQAEDTIRLPRACLCSPPEESAGRNLVVCIDGTSNQFGVTNTNIVELYSHITKSDTQLTYYCSGLGTAAHVGKLSLRHHISNAWDMAFGRNLHKVIMASYRWLSDNYKDGDKIFLFGFSRGAYQVRALAGMIARVGLLLQGNNEQIPFAFELYLKTGDDHLSSPQRDSVISQPLPKDSERRARYAMLAETFKRTFCRSDVRIHFVGVWDTVSSVGLGRSRTLPCTTTSCNHICYFRHALALDERRVKFLPEYIYGGRSSSADDEHIKEVWFAGCHGDVGGGNRRNEKLQSGDIPLLWMRSQAVAAGLEMDHADVMWKIDDLNKPITNSMNFRWWLLELLPLKHLLYYNSDRHTSSPHMGSPRRILPGQKVHVSVLFKNNYKPHAQFYNYPEMWPEPMFWNDANSHRRLQELSNMWEKDIFDEHSALSLLDQLKGDQPGRPSVDMLDRLAFMSSFGTCRDAFRSHNGVHAALSGYLDHKTSSVIRLSSAVTFCELDWPWPATLPVEGLVERITGDLSNLLESEDERGRACRYLPSLCKRAELREGLIKWDNLRRLVSYLDNTRVDKNGQETLPVAFHSAQALAMLMKLDAEFAQKLIQNEAVTDITSALHSKCTPALVSILTVVDGLAKSEDGRHPMKAGMTVPTLLSLVKRFDDFVAPAAIRVLCSFLPDNHLRETMLRFRVLPTFFDVLEGCSEETKQVARQALVEFMKYGDIRDALIRDDCLRKFAQRAQHKDCKRDGAILALVILGNTQVSTAVKEVIDAERTIPVLTARLNNKSTALSAASALAQLVKIENVAKMVSEGEAVSRIVSMLPRRCFDGQLGEDGLQVLSQLLDCERLRKAVLKAGAIAELEKMIKAPAQQFEIVHAGLHYLRVLARFDEDGNALPNGDARSLIPHVVNTFSVPRRRVHMIAMELLRSFSVEDDLRTLIVDELLGLLKDRRAGMILAVSTMLRLLSLDKSVRDQVLPTKEFQDACHDFYDGLTEVDEYGERGRSGPTKREVYHSVGRMIQLMQMHDESGETAAPLTPTSVGRGLVLMRDPYVEEKRWLASGPVRYELKRKKHKNKSQPGGGSSLSWFSMPSWTWYPGGR